MKRKQQQQHSTEMCENDCETRVIMFYAMFLHVATQQKNSRRKLFENVAVGRL